jgi:SAM-dependent methyltransferase
MLGHLRSFGFRNLTGIDPFLVSEVTDDGVRLIRAGLSDIPADPQYGLILFNHSLEHLDGPLDALRAACSRLLDGGRIVVSLPIIGGSAWQRYRDNLFSLDAPLHRFVPTPPGMDRLVRRAGAEVIRWVGGSTSWYYLASEAIRRGVNPELVHPRSIFGERQQAWAEQMARRERGREAGEATFLIRPVR